MAEVTFWAVLILIALAYAAIISAAIRQSRLLDREIRELGEQIDRIADKVDDT